jgi:hypothetical protein
MHERITDETVIAVINRRVPPEVIGDYRGRYSTGGIVQFLPF